MSQAKITYLLIVITWYILFFIFFIFLYIKYKKPYHLKCYVPIYKEIPEKLSPIELSMLLYHKITPNALTATIAYLIDSNVVKLMKADISIETTGDKIGKSNIHLNAEGKHKVAYEVDSELFYKILFDCI